jgi:ornithine carbamoyltransferase
LTPNEINLGKREGVYDVAKNLERMVQGIMIRTFAHEIVENLSKWAKIPIINGLTDFSHPCQAMADYLTLQEYKGDLRGKKICYVGDGNNVAHSLMDAGARLGVDVTIACPRGYEPNLYAWQLATEAAKEIGAKIEVVTDPKEGVKGADAVYTDVWASMGQEAETAIRKAIFMPYQVNAKLMSYAKDDAIFMHCLPAHRGDEVTDEVIDAGYSVVFPEAENRLHAQKAVMYQLMKK